MTDKTHRLMKSIGEEISTRYSQYIVNIEDGDGSTLASVCNNLGDPFVITKYADSVTIGDLEFKRDSSGTLNTARRDYEYNDPNSDFEDSLSSSLQQFSTSTVSDFGTVILNGDVSVIEESQVCFGRDTTSYAPYETIHLSVPFQSGALLLSLGFRRDIMPGVYRYADLDDADMVYISASCSPSEICESLSGHYWIDSADAEVVISSISPERITGSFSFTQEAGNQGYYSGEFDIVRPEAFK